jgi:hypothetical protein
MRAKIDPELVKELNITNIQPVKKKNGGINGVGNISCFGFIGDQKVKIYTTFRDDLPAQREELETYVFDCPVRFPPLIATKGKFVVEHWIDGPNLTQIPKKQVMDLVPNMVDFLFEFKNIQRDFDSEYDHLKCFRDTVAKRGNHNKLIKLWDKEYEAFLDKFSHVPKHLRHGDLHEANIVLNGGTMYIVDNDGISYDNGWFTAWRKSFLYSTAFPRYPIIDMYDNWKQLELDYYQQIPFKLMELTQFLRQAFFQRNFVDFSNKVVTEQDIVRRLG